MKNIKVTFKGFAIHAAKVAAWTLVFLALAIITQAPANAATTNTNDSAAVTTDGIVASAMSADDPYLSGIGMLRQIFGSVVDNPLSPSTISGAGDTALGQVFGIINMSLLAVGSFWLVYNIGAGVAQTAQDGQFLGKRFSSLWVPVRLVGGITSLVPVFHGWALCQLVVLYCATLGVGIANMASVAVAKYLDAGGQVVNVPATSVNSKFVNELYKINLCVSSINADAGSKVLAKQTVGQVVSYGSMGDSMCGAVQLPTSSNANAQRASLSAFTMIDGVIAAHTDRLATTIKESMQQDSKTTKLHIADDVDLPTYTQIYQTTLRTNLATALNTNTRLASDTSRTGFAGLGMYYSRMSGMIDQQNVAMQVQASILKPALPENFTTSTIGETFKYAYQIMGGYNAVASLNFALQKTNPTADESVLIHEFKTQADASLPHGCNGTNDTASNGKAILAAVIDATGCESSALARMKNTGDYLSVVGMLGIGTAAVAQTAAAVPILGAGLKVFADMFLTLMQTLTFFSLMLSTYLPLLPYIAWLGALASWLVVVIEGVVAAPLWAFAHLDTEGEGMGSRSEKGYTFLLNVLLRPVLMVVGFLASTIMIDVLGKFFFLTYVGDGANPLINAAA